MNRIAKPCVKRSVGDGLITYGYSTDEVKPICRGQIFVMAAAELFAMSDTMPFFTRLKSSRSLRTDKRVIGNRVKIPIKPPEIVIVSLEAADREFKNLFFHGLRKVDREGDRKLDIMIHKFTHIDLYGQNTCQYSSQKILIHING